MMKGLRNVLLAAIAAVFLCGCSSGTKEIVEIPITLENWDEYFELKSTTEVINEERRIKEADIFYQIALKDKYLDKVVTEKESEIKYKVETCMACRTITFVEGKNEIVFGEITRKASPEIREGSIFNAVFGEEERVYEGEGWSYGVKTKSEEADLETTEEFEMLEIEGNLYLYSK